MTQQEILNQNWTKTAKAKALYNLGYTRRQVADLICNGNYGFAHNIWKKWNSEITNNNNSSEFNFEFNRTFGIELEIYGPNRNKIIAEFRRQGLTIQSEMYNHTTRGHWKIVSDSSINGVNGNEIVSPVLRGMDGIEQIKKVCIALSKAGAKVNKSCGFHLHIGVNDYNLENFKSLLTSFIRLENSFDKIQPVSRRKNNNTYCRNLSSARDVFNRISGANTITETSNIFTGRYYKLNLKSYRTYGTVEFRHHSGTTKFSKIKNWILICSRLVEFAKQKGFVDNFRKFLNDSLYEYTEDRAIDLA